MATTTEKDTSGFDKISNDTTKGLKTSIGGSSTLATNRSEKDLTSETTEKTVKNGTSEQIQDSTRKVGSKTVVSRSSSEKANIGFNISFSIPFQAPVPIDPTSNC